MQRWPISLINLAALTDDFHLECDTQDAEAAIWQDGVETVISSGDECFRRGDEGEGD